MPDGLPWVYCDVKLAEPPLVDAELIGSGMITIVLARIRFGRGKSTIDRKRSPLSWPWYFLLLRADQSHQLATERALIGLIEPGVKGRWQRGGALGP